MSHIFIPSSGPGDWRCLLADPKKHWARGYSARTLAHCWEDADGFPPEIRSVLSQNPVFSKIEPLLIPLLEEWTLVPATRDGVPVEVELLLVIPPYLA